MPCRESRTLLKMLNLSGWAGPAPHADAEHYLRARSAGSAGLTESSFRSGAHWAFAAPAIAADGGIAVAIRGEPMWRTNEPAIRNAENAARAVLEAYRRHAERFLDVMFGSFAVAITDVQRGSTLLAVDRMGVERLTYARHGAALVFSTSAELVARFPGRDPRVDRQALLSYMYFHMIPSPQTAFDGVRKLPLATALEWKNGTLREFRYWEPTFAVDGAASQDSLRDALHESLTTAVRAAQPGDRSGAFLSGGLDSSTVAGFLAKERPGQARTFSIGFGFADYDELEYARIANTRFGCQATEYEVTPDDITDVLPRVAQAYDEPFGNASAIPTYCCARLARQHGVDHLLAGDGGDEIFAGNKRYAEQRVFERYQSVPAALRSWLLEPVLASLPPALAVSVLRKGRNYIARARIPLPDRLEIWNFLHQLGFEAILHSDFRAAVDEQGPLEHMRTVYNGAPRAELVDRMLYYDWRFTLADNDLRKVGTMCELAGVRVSYPMLHQDVVDVSTRVPAGMKMRGTQLRSFYKDAMQGFLPQEIIQKTKHGFGLPFGMWLQRSPRLADLIDSNLASLSSRKIVRAEFLDRLRQLQDREDAHYYGVLIFTLAMLEQWFQDHRISP